jgi:hypothetical protein
MSILDPRTDFANEVNLQRFRNSAKADCTIIAMCIGLKPNGEFNLYTAHVMPHAEIVKILRSAIDALERNDTTKIKL